MNRFEKRRGLLLGGALAALAINTAAFAQDAAGESAAGDIIVTARRVEERLQDVPVSITVMDQRQLANRNITVANDLAAYTPSLSSNERYGPEKQTFSLRGFNQDANTAPTVGVYFAEVVGVRAQGGTVSGSTVGAGAFMDLANVQVLKGPQGTLFGRNTTGGAILLTPQKPTDRLEGYVEGAAGNYHMWRLQGALNVPLSDTFKVRLAADHMERDGYVQNLSSVGGAYSDRNYTAVRLSIVANLTPDLENYTVAHYSHSDTAGFVSRIIGYDRSAVAGVRGLTAQSAADQLARQTARGDNFYDVESGVQNPYLKLDIWQVINTTTWRAGDNLTLKNIASYGEFRERDHFDLYGSNFRVSAAGFNLVTPVPAGTPYKYIELDTGASGSTGHQSTFTDELQVQGTGFDGKLNYVLGGYLEFSRPLGDSAGYTGIFLNCTSPRAFACSNPLGFGSISDSRTQQAYDNHGIFAQATYKLTDKFSLTGGLRYTFDTIHGFTTSTRISLDPAARNPASFIDPVTGARIARQCVDSFRHGNGFVQDVNACRTDITTRSTSPTWVIDADFKPSNDMLLYAKWSRGYRQGGINFTNPGVETWKPEHMDSYEIGAKTSFRGTVSGYLNLAGFYNKLRDMQVFAGLVSGVPSVAGGAAIVNAGKARSYGIEADGSVTFFNSLRFDLGGVDKLASPQAD